MFGSIEVVGKEPKKCCFLPLYEDLQSSVGRDLAPVRVLQSRMRRTETAYSN